MYTILPYLQIAFEIWASNDRYEVTKKDILESSGHDLPDILSDDDF